MSREITKLCEFSCDEAVLVKVGYTNPRSRKETWQRGILSDKQEVANQPSIEKYFKS